MAIQQTKKQSDLEKRMALLRRQVYGSLTYQHIKTPNSQTDETQIPSDDTYLRQDLLKIATFSGVAIGVQIITFFLLRNQVLKLNFL